MPKTLRYPAYAAALATVFFAAGCVIAPSGQNRNQGYNQPNYSAAPVDISDLYNGPASHAEQQLRARGFNQTRATPPSEAGFSNSWWLNQQTSQCFQLETAHATVMTLNPRTPQDCGGGSAYQNNPPQYGGGGNYQNNGYQAEKVDIADLRHGSIEHAEKQLYARGFNKVGGSNGYSSSYDSLWVNTRTSQCFKIIGANNTVSTILSQNPNNCH